MIFYLVPAGVMLVAQSLDPTILPQSSRLAADFTGAERFLYGGFDALADSFFLPTVHVKAQPTEFLFHLQHFKLASGRPLEFGDQGFQVCA